MPSYGIFEFNLPDALLEQLVQKLETIEDAPLSPEVVVAEVQETQGVYQLFLDGNLSYIGKTDADAGLRQRLERHSFKIMHRVGLDPTRVTFRAVRILVFTTMELEKQLLDYHAVKTWNNSGFGSNDPGRERDTTNYKVDHFDALYPIDIDRPLTGLIVPARAPAAEYFRRLRENIPYTFRAQNAGGRSKKPHPDLNQEVNVTLPHPVTTRTLITEVVTQLEPGWQATMLPSHVILYKEDKDYPSGKVLIRSAGPP